MKIFLKSHFILLLAVMTQGVFTWSYFWFIGFHAWGHVIYSIFIQLLFILGYLTYCWIEDYKLYHWIQSSDDTTRLIPSLGTSYFSKRLHERIIKEKEKADRKIVESEAEIKERVTFMNQWVHQMKTPISVIHLMIQDQDDPVFQDMRKELFKLEEGLKTVLYSSRLSMFGKDYHIESFPIAPFLKELIKENKRLFFQFNVYPHLKETEERSILSDKKWLKFAIEQILSNAVKYSTKKANRVDLKVEKVNKRVLLTITDYGVGIPEQDVRRVCDPYFTGVNGRKYHESTGMGLYLAKEILGKLDHKMTITSEVNKGTTVCIDLSK
ncbi:sensor histidine kinase [Salipaludibacillus agaradhaerens]|uniref:sensor histidine kinase n=1 Tax=Salipaludibacillus agaradhaerens TaxID=76935 RepID=UPI000997111B|nr:sensor histidine kinase [Salipaludibacillus agaradhaerens]